MYPESLRLFFRAGIFVTLLSAALVWVAPRESPQFVVSVCSLAIGLTLSGLVILVSRLLE